MRVKRFAKILLISTLVSFLSYKACTTNKASQVIQPKVNQFLNNPIHTIQEDKTTFESHRIIALSNLAEGFTNLSIKDPSYKNLAGKSLDLIVKTALDPNVSPYTEKLPKVESFGNHGLYLSHLNVILGAYKRATGSDKFKTLNEKISNYLADRSVTDIKCHMPSYPADSTEPLFKWPADQSVTLYSLYLFDKNYKTDISEDPIADWLCYMDDSATDKSTNLHFSEVSRNTSFSRQSRGCALSWSVRYMHNFAPKEAKELWENYKKHHKKSAALIAGFREWNPNSPFKDHMDLDSGPIMYDVGIAATAFGIGASKKVDDKITYWQLKNIERIGEFIASKNESIGEIANSLLAESIQFNINNMTQWYD